MDSYLEVSTHTFYLNFIVLKYEYFHLKGSHLAFLPIT